VVNDREYGGILHRDAGRTCCSAALAWVDADVFALKQSASGTLVTGTNRGVFHSTERQQMACEERQPDGNRS